MQLNDVVGNEDAVGRLKCIARDGNMPHLILTVRSRNDLGIVSSSTHLDKYKNIGRVHQGSERPPAFWLWLEKCLAMHLKMAF